MLPNPSSQNCLNNCAEIVFSSVNETLRKISPRLASWFAAKQFVREIRRRKVVHRLCGFSLAEAGCVQLLDFLTSPAGFHCRETLTELYLPQNGIAAQGLLAIARFLRDNSALRELSLYGNPLTTDPDVVTEFASALNSSRLRILLILDETCPGDPFLQLLLPRLDAPYLQHLRVATKCSQAIVPTIVEYVRSSQCRLHRLDCKLSEINMHGVTELLYTVGMNTCLQHSELGLDIESHTSSGYWLQCSRTLHADVQRNIVLNARVRNEALALLRYSRALFLHSARGKLATSSSRFFDLPVELVQEIIAYLAPSLSPQQRIRVVSYAADIRTLFPPSHRARAGGDLVTRLKIFAHLGTTPPVKTERFGGNLPPTCRECGSTSCLEASCPRQRKWRMDMRDLWLTQVACDSFDCPAGVNPSAGFPILHFKTPISTTLDVSYIQPQ